MENKRKRGRPKTYNARGTNRKVRLNYDELCRTQEILDMTGQNFSEYVRGLLYKDWLDKMT